MAYDIFHSMVLERNIIMAIFKIFNVKSCLNYCERDKNDAYDLKCYFMDIFRSDMKYKLAHAS